MSEGLGAIGSLLLLFGLVLLAVLAFLLPWFVYRIKTNSDRLRESADRIDRNLERLANEAEASLSPPSTPPYR